MCILVKGPELLHLAPPVQGDKMSFLLLNMPKNLKTLGCAPLSPLFLNTPGLEAVRTRLLVYSGVLLQSNNNRALSSGVRFEIIEQLFPVPRVISPGVSVRHQSWVAAQESFENA